VVIRKGREISAAAKRTGLDCSGEEDSSSGEAGTGGDALPINGPTCLKDLSE